MSSSLINNSRDIKKKAASGNSAFNVVLDDQPIEVKGNLLSDIEFDAITTDFPDAVTEIYFYMTGGISGSIVATITVVYIDSTKKLIDTVERT